MANKKQGKNVNPLISKRLHEIMEIRGMKQVDVLEKAQPIAERFGLKLTKSDLSQYYNGWVAPGQEKAFILGQVLDVDEGWLLGFNSPMERRNENAAEDDSSYSRTAEYIELFSLLEDTEKDLIIRQIKGILSSR